MNQPKVKSCGVLVLRRAPELEFLLMCHPGRYDLPKGHIEGAETELECALRELREETGIPASAVTLDPSFRYTETYYPRYKRFGGRRVEKTLVIFLGWLSAESTHREITVAEHPGFEWRRWAPPHRIQPQTVDGLLAAVDAHLRAGAP